MKNRILCMCVGVIAMCAVMLNSSDAEAGRRHKEHQKSRQKSVMQLSQASPGVCTCLNCQCAERAAEAAKAAAPAPEKETSSYEYRSDGTIWLNRDGTEYKVVVLEDKSDSSLFKPMSGYQLRIDRTMYMLKSDFDKEAPEIAREIDKWRQSSQKQSRVKSSSSRNLTTGLSSVARSAWRSLPVIC